MALFLVQHGRSMTKDEDPERGLSRQGVLESELIADHADRHRLQVRTILHSGKKRALQTAEIFAATLQPPRGIDQLDGMAPMDDPAALAAHLRPEDNQLLVSHLPFLERLISQLIIGAPAPPLIAMQNSGIVCLDQEPANRAWRIIWTLQPKIAS